MARKQDINKIIDRPTGLYRSESNRVIAGVCGGLGEFFSIDPTIIRIIFILITIFGGSGLLLYLILWVVVPTESSVTLSSDESIRHNVEEMKSKAQRFATNFRSTAPHKDSKIWWGLLILLLGLIFLFSNFGIFDFFFLQRLWPLILIVFGIAILLRK